MNNMNRVNYIMFSIPDMKWD